MRTPPSWVLDTNVVVSGLLNVHAYPGRLIDAVLSGTLRLTYDDRIEQEYREVLARPRFGFSSAARSAFLLELRNQDAVAAAVWPGQRKLPDEDDLVFLEVARYATDRVLVTGNARHFPAVSRADVVVISPAEAWTRLAR